MASACIRTMTLSQNINNSQHNNNNMIPQNCVIISSQNYSSIHHQQQQQQQSQLPTLTVTTTTAAANKMTAIAPAPPSGTGRNSNSILGMNGVNLQQSHQHQQPIDSIRGYKKKYTYANMPYGEQPPSVARRNARERNRVKQVNNGFANLRQHIPQTVITALTNGGRGASKKLSKVDTLRMAVEYINRLQELISDSDSDTSSNYNSNISSAGSPVSQYFPASPEPSSTGSSSHHHHHNQYNNSHNNQSNNNNNSNNFSMQTPTYSETSASPTPSCSSELSIGSNHHYGVVNISSSQQQFKYEPYDNYNSITDTTPEDEELLDYISSWQEQ